MNPSGSPHADADQQLIARVATGDQLALRDLYDRHAGWLIARLQARCQQADLVDEALQDTFIAIWKSAGTYEHRGDVGAWMWGIAVRRLIGVIRKQPRTLRPTLRDATVVSAEDQVLSGIEHGGLAGALGSLSPELRAVVQATVLDGLTTREAAVLLGIPPGTVKTRMMRAKAQMRGALA